ncbi:LEA type 2 family protein [Leptospira sarikeiensis]|nr:LEA type 2 family protein [Leptospira sarikeiensis]
MGISFFLSQRKRTLLFWVCIFGPSLFFDSCIGLRDNVKKLQACKYRILETKTEKIEIQSFPPSPKIVLNSSLEIENPNDSEVKIYKFDLGVVAASSNGHETELARVTSGEEIEIQAFSKTVVQLRIETSFENRQGPDKLLLGILVVRSLLAGKDPNLRMKGIVKYKTVFGEVDLPVDEKIQIAKKPEHEI